MHEIEQGREKKRHSRCIELISSCDKPCVHDGISSRVEIAFILANSLMPGTEMGKNGICFIQIFIDYTGNTATKTTNTKNIDTGNLFKCFKNTYFSPAMAPARLAQISPC